MLILAIDTALQRCSVAIAQGERLLAVELREMEKGHAEHLAPMTAAALARAGVRVADLDRVGVTIGPGGFTGVRVGLAFARGLVIGVKARAVGVTTLAALAAGSADGAGEERIAPVIDARRGEVYAALYDRLGAELIPPFVAAPATALERLRAAPTPPLLCGSGADIIRAIEPGWRSASPLAQIDPAALVRLCAAAPLPDGAPAPLYLRAPDAKPARPSPLCA